MRSKLLGIAALALQLASGQGRGGAGAGAGAVGTEKPEEGIPVTNALVIEKCGTCHTKDDKGNLSRISWERTTPEGWEGAIKRMVRLNGLQMTPVEARTVLKYLSTYHGLAPEEAKPVMYIAERRIQDENVPNDNIRSTCMNCHALGRAFSWRRTKEEWKLLTNLHSALYPQAEAAFRFRMGPQAPAGGGGRGGTGAGGPGGPGGGGGPMPVDETVDFLAKDYPLHTPEWAAWRARMRAPKIAGRWLVSAYIIGRGKYYGEMTIEPGVAEDEFVTKVNLKSIRGGPSLSQTGTGLVYAGYSWRGRGKPAGMPAGTSPNDLSHEMRQVMWIAPDQLSAEGRWFWGAYDEFGFDVKMERASDGPMLITADRTSLKAGTENTA
ncbi:MAG TPA: hypothetical protein VKE70_19540, partial [Candidatus Solibacter sp.]|nr:hypothetical protein [Candidatus Solibacter sp.]